MDITLSEKHGLNPTIPVCFWCGEPKNEVALLGKLKNDEKASQYSILDYEPCDKCKESFSQGLLLIEVTAMPNDWGKFPIQKDAYPTGRYIVAKKELVDIEQDVVLMEQKDFLELTKDFL